MANSIAYFAYAYVDGDALVAHRRRIAAQRIALGPTPSVLFGAGAFAITDPDGNGNLIIASWTPVICVRPTASALCRCCSLLLNWDCVGIGNHA